MVLDQDLVAAIREDLAEIHARSPRPSFIEAGNMVVALNFQDDSSSGDHNNNALRAHMHARYLRAAMDGRRWTDDSEAWGHSAAVSPRLPAVKRSRESKEEKDDGEHSDDGSMPSLIDDETSSSESESDDDDIPSLVSASSSSSSDDSSGDKCNDENDLANSVEHLNLWSSAGHRESSASASSLLRRSSSLGSTMRRSTSEGAASGAGAAVDWRNDLESLGARTPEMKRGNSWDGLPTRSASDDDALQEIDIGAAASGAHVSAMEGTDDGDNDDATVFVWGGGDDYRLMNGTNESITTRPHAVRMARASLREQPPRSLSLGSSHTSIVAFTGSVYVAGRNDENQLLGQEGEHIEQLAKIEALSQRAAASVSVGVSHTVVVTDDGVAMSFGNNEFGQLGHAPATDDEDVAGKRCLVATVPRAVHIPLVGGANRKVSMVSCGENFTVILLQPGGTVYTCGIDSQGQLGRGSPTPEQAAVPAPVHALSAIPIAHVAAGAHHCFAVSITGRLFSWGRNKHGQLGLGVKITAKTAVVRTPQPVLSLLPGEFAGADSDDLSRCVKHVSCGRDHSAAVTKNGHLWTCGRNNAGQLGNRTTHSTLAFGRVPVVTPTTGEHHFIKDVACGDEHTLVLSSNNQVFSFGSGSSGQLGLVNFTENKSVPVPVTFRGLRGKILGVFAGGNASAAISSFKKSRRLYVDKYLDVTVGWTTDRFLSEIASAKARFGGLASLVRRVFSSASLLNACFLGSGGRHGAIDAAGVVQVYEDILSSPNMEGALVDACTQCCKSLVNYPYHSEDTVRVMIILFLVPSKISGRKGLVQMLCKMISSLKDVPLEALTQSLVEDVPRDVLIGRIIRPLRRSFDNYIDRYVKLGRRPVGQYASNLSTSMSVLTMLHKMCMASQKVPHDEFLSSAAGSLTIDQLVEEYQKWRQSTQLNIISFPYLLPPDLKRTILQEVEARIHMSVAARDGVNEAYQNLSMHSPLGGLGALLFGGNMQAVGAAQYFVLRVRRNNLLQDAMHFLQMVLRSSPKDVKKPLRVVFDGEEGVDGGGLRKEFFQLLCEEIFNPQRGMFLYNKETRLTWFAGGTFESAESFAMIGTLMGIAIYNGILLDLHFPLVLYKLLLGKLVDETDLGELEPGLGRTLANLRDYGPGLEEDLQLTFEIDETDLFGAHTTHELVVGGSEKNVTCENVDFYIDRYVARKVVGRHQEQINAFRHGFHFVINGPALELFTPSELKTLVCGVDDLDFAALEDACAYEGGYSPEHPAIIKFWKCVHGLSESEKFEFLRFSTGCARAPIGGLGNLHPPFKIQRAGPDAESLPTASTCFNTVLLNEYANVEKMKKKLLVAIHNYEGFGLE